MLNGVSMAAAWYRYFKAREGVLVQEHTEPLRWTLEMSKQNPRKEARLRGF